MSNKSPHAGVTCRGSMALGSGCGRCEKCRFELSQWGGKVPANHVPTTGADGYVYLKPVIDPGRRERIATAALQGVLAGGLAQLVEHQASNEAIAYKAVTIADALIAELDRKGGK
jgi:hypothetical protein